MSKPFRVVIVENERLARKELQTMLSNYSEIEVVGEAKNVDQAVTLIQRENPDVVFLDIHMPGKSGFDLLDRIAVTFKIIFVTAFDNYAIRAFEVNALDYLLKPITKEKLDRAIKRLPNPVMDPLYDHLEYNDRIFLSINDHARFVEISTIQTISAEGEYTRIHQCSGETISIRRSLKQWESCLPNKHFVRIHRSTLINLSYVERVEPWFNYSYRVYLKGSKDPFTLSRRYAKKLKDRF